MWNVLRAEQLTLTELLLECRKPPLKVDVIDLTLLLKSMGLKLEYLDFDADKSSTETLTVEIRCHKSGVLARMSYDLVDCSCPVKDEKETSFWEVQATGPSVFSKHKNNTSSNLLPEISENCSMVSKAMLSNLLDYYRTSMKAIEQAEDVLQSPLKVTWSSFWSPRSPVAKENKNRVTTPPAEGKFMARIESVATPDGANENKTSSNSDISNSVEDSSSTTTTDTSNNSAEHVGINNTTKELSNSYSSDKPVITIEPLHNKSHKSKMPDDSAFANSEAIKAFITSSPNEKGLKSGFNAEQNHERDLVTVCLEQARKEIDIALRVMKHVSTVTTTPQTVVRRKLGTPLFAERSSSLTNINRRMSLPGHPSPQPKLPQNSSASKKFTAVASKLASVTSTGRGDTPRPITGQKTATVLRKTSSSASISSAGSSGSTVKTGTKKKESIFASSGAMVPTPSSIAQSQCSGALTKKKGSWEFLELDTKISGTKVPTPSSNRPDPAAPTVIRRKIVKK
ncbi:protein PRRC2C-like [Sabethes cyaneus]|uniref:protein PRRC2C-like n=1 Tax=Sabethes cyaneus TaxID=53552 RepID=UPI00237E9D8F|nr:protein PRRC2C-like [Sabethes cyaneus]